MKERWQDCGEYAVWCEVFECDWRRVLVMVKVRVKADVEVANVQKAKCSDEVDLRGS